MAKPSQAPLVVRVANILTVTLLRAGVKLKGAGNYPMYLLTVRGRKSGLPRTVPIESILCLSRRSLGDVFAVYFSRKRLFCRIDSLAQRVGLVYRKGTVPKGVSLSLLSREPAERRFFE